jgi:hypothetical protein
MAVTRRMINGERVWVIDRRFKGEHGAHGGTNLVQTSMLPNIDSSLHGGTDRKARASMASRPSRSVC